MKLDKIPAKVRKVVESSEVNPSIHFIETISVIRKEPCLRLYAYKHTKTRGLECKEVGRRFVDRDMVSGSLYYTRLGGYNVVWDKKKKIGYYYTLEVDNRFYEIDKIRSDLKYPNRYFNRLYTAKELEQAFKGVDEKLKYLYVDNLDDIDNSMEYIRTFREHQSLERLAKAGFTYLWESKQIYRLGEEMSNKLTSFLKNNRTYIVSNKPKLGQILQAIKLEMNAADYDRFCKTNEIKNKLESHDIKFAFELISEIYSYILKQKSDIDTYCDYIRTAKNVGMNINDRGILFPRNIVESHDNIIELEDKKINEETNKGLEKAFSIIKPFIENTGEFQLVIPKTQSDLVKWGNELNCCVGRLSYGKHMAKGETIILGVFLNNKIIECCEIGIIGICRDDCDRKLKIIQCRGNHNLDSEYHKEAIKLAENFIANYKPKQLIGSCI